MNRDEARIYWVAMRLHEFEAVNIFEATGIPAGIEVLEGPIHVTRWAQEFNLK